MWLMYSQCDGPRHSQTAFTTITYEIMLSYIIQSSSPGRLTCKNAPQQNKFLKLLFSTCNVQRQSLKQKSFKLKKVFFWSLNDFKMEHANI